MVHDTDRAKFARSALLTWTTGSGTFRDFPWRATRDPYNILMAEMMLRRTQARQVVPVYKLFIDRYPNVGAPDVADETDVGGVLKPLGLYWRAANFKTLARELILRFAGQVPGSREELLSLPGVGPYVASAVQCFAFNMPVPIVDTNTVRIAARYFGFEYNPESRRRRDVIAAVGQLVESDHAAASNYALLDLAAAVCKPGNPQHEICPLLSHCTFGQQAKELANQAGIENFSYSPCGIPDPNTDQTEA